MSQPTYIVTTEQQVTVVVSPDETTVVSGETTSVVLAEVPGPAGPTGPTGTTGPAGADADNTLGAISGPYRISTMPGSVSDDMGAGAVGTAGFLTVHVQDSAGVDFPLALYMSQVGVGGLVQVLWAGGGKRVYERTVGDPGADFDLTYGVSYIAPVTLKYKTGSLPAAGTAVRVTLIPAPTSGAADPADPFGDDHTWAWGDAAQPVYTSPAAGSRVVGVRLTVRTALDGIAPTIVLDGPSGVVFDSTDSDPKTAGSYEIDTDEVLTSGQQLTLTITPDGSTAGSGVLTVFVI